MIPNLACQVKFIKPKQNCKLTIKKGGGPVHKAPAYAGSEKGSNHLV